jgi:hypothetical protein
MQFCLRAFMCEKSYGGPFMFFEDRPSRSSVDSGGNAQATKKPRTEARGSFHVRSSLVRSRRKRLLPPPPAVTGDAYDADTHKGERAGFGDSGLTGLESPNIHVLKLREIGVVWD